MTSSGPTPPPSSSQPSLASSKEPDGPLFNDPERNASNQSSPCPDVCNSVDLDRGRAAVGPVEQKKSSATSPEPPYHTYNLRLKVTIICVVSAVGTLSGLSSNIYFPAQAELAKSLNISHETVNLSITTYMIAQGLSPAFWGPVADHQGRRIILIGTTLFYMVSNVALALTVNGPMLLAFRACQAAGSASTIALGSGVIADMFSPSERGSYLGWFSGIRQFSLALGPILGGALAENLGWRSLFWFLAAFSACLNLAIVLCLPETLRRISGNGSTMSLSWKYRPLLWSLMRKANLGSDHPECLTEIKPPPPFTLRTLTAPLELLIEPDALCALLFGGCVYTAWSMMVASTTYTLQSIYQFNTLQVGLAFLANGIGCIAGSVLAGKSLNFDFYREVKLWQHAHNINPDTAFSNKALPASFPLEHARLSRGPLYSIVSIWALLLFGWSLTAPPPGPTDDPKAHWITPLLAQAAVGWSATSVLTSNSALIVDLFPNSSASVSAVMNMSRCLLGAAGVAAVEPFLQVYGAGWTSVLLAGIVAVGLVPYGLHAVHGQRWRAARERRNIQNK